ncbi:MAG: aminotransferase class V-fold PLP-dependent enzyme [Bacteroidota bacterium]|nr:aminotransferase class V-fold PLP-dependent enzyme [Bacteroidota bacterium]
MIPNNLRDQFLLKKDITYLNFGAFGACARPIFEVYQKFQLELEEEPTLFIQVNGPRYLKASRTSLAQYLSCGADDIVYVTNPSYAVNIIAKSFDLKIDDEVLTTNLEYGASDRTWKYYCNKKGATYVRQKIRFPLESKEDFLNQFLSGVTSKTKLIFISHITSSTGLRLPVEEICAFAKEKNILIFIDGAHAPGQVKINLSQLDPDFYTGACHKWMLTPKGSSFLYVRNNLQHLFDPLLISWGYESDNPSASQFLDYHQLQGTRDYSAFLTIPTAINFLEENNWDLVSKQCRIITQNNAERFCELLNATSLCPVNDDFIQQMYSIPLNIKSPEKLHDLLYEKYKIQVPVMFHEGQFYLRYSIQAFNNNEDLDKLYAALEEIAKSDN